MTTCRICSCIDDDCTWCVVLTGEPCFWVEEDLCSACQMGSTDEDRAYNRGRLAWDMGQKRGMSVPGKAELLGHATKMLRVWSRAKYRRLRCERVAASQPSPSAHPVP